MEANIIVSGVPRIQDSQENIRRVAAAVGAFRRRYSGAIIEEPKTKPVGRNSQTITFAVKAPDLKSAQAMQAFFEQQLVQNGFAPTDNDEDAQAAAEDLLRRVSGSGSNVTYIKDSSGARKKPWWKFW